MSTEAEKGLKYPIQRWIERTWDPQPRLAIDVERHVDAAESLAHAAEVLQIPQLVEDHYTELRATVGRASDEMLLGIVDHRLLRGVDSTSDERFPGVPSLYGEYKTIAERLQLLRKEKPNEPLLDIRQVFGAELGSTLKTGELFNVLVTVLSRPDMTLEDVAAYARTYQDILMGEVPELEDLGRPGYKGIRGVLDRIRDARSGGYRVSPAEVMQIFLRRGNVNIDPSLRGIDVVRLFGISQGLLMIRYVQGMEALRGLGEDTKEAAAEQFGHPLERLKQLQEEYYGWVDQIDREGNVVKDEKGRVIQVKVSVDDNIMQADVDRKAANKALNSLDLLTVEEEEIWANRLASAAQAQLGYELRRDELRDEAAAAAATVQAIATHTDTRRAMLKNLRTEVGLTRLTLLGNQLVFETVTANVVKALLEIRQVEDYGRRLIKLHAYAQAMTSVALEVDAQKRRILTTQGIDPAAVGLVNMGTSLGFRGYEVPDEVRLVQDIEREYERDHPIRPDADTQSGTGEQKPEKYDFE